MCMCGWRGGGEFQGSKMALQEGFNIHDCSSRKQLNRCCGKFGSSEPGFKFGNVRHFI